MRIALVNMSLEPGRGSDIVVTDLATKLSRDHDVTVYSLRSVAEAERPFRVVAPRPSQGLEKLGAALTVLRQISRDADRYDIVNSHHALLSLLLPRARLVTTYHGYRGRLNLVLGKQIGEALSNLIRRIPIRIALRRSKAVTIVSDALTDEVLRSGCRESRLIYNGVNALPKHVATPPRHFLYVGRLDPDKSVGALLDAYARAKVPVPLLIVGDGAERRQLEARYTDARFHFLGRKPREALPALFAGAYAFATASEFETFCLPVIEAAQFGCPALGPASGALTEVIRPGVTGMLAAPDRLAEAMEAIYALPAAEREAMQLACRDWAARFTWEYSAKSYVEIYAAVSTSGGRLPCIGLQG